MSQPLKTSTLKKFLKLALSKLEGDWIIVGGTVLPLLEVNYRTTTDIDFVPIGNATQEQNLKLMEVCEKLGLPIETVNTAAAYFVRKIPDFTNHLVLLNQGKKAKIYRPDTYLFIALKIGRLSETDLSDCLEMIRAKKVELKEPDVKRLQKQIKDQIRAASEEKSLRLKSLMEALSNTKLTKL
jgi:predicted nucleotidyltransferase